MELSPTAREKVRSAAKSYQARRCAELDRIERERRPMVIELLKTTSKNVTDVAKECGISRKRVTNIAREEGIDLRDRGRTLNSVLTSARFAKGDSAIPESLSGDGRSLYWLTQPFSRLAEGSWYYGC